ncbi:MAG: SDR family oxidoreductase [Burkholderiales bacterium]|nr:SDR family oxidoreductase [Burkholderiales bacterium]
MKYFVTGATGFIGKRLVQRLLERRGSVVYFLLREQESASLDLLYRRWGASRSRVIPVVGDLTAPMLGVCAMQLEAIRGKIAHLFHLAAVYDLRANEEALERANVHGTRNVIAFAEAIQVGCLHHVSSIAAAGLYDGVFSEDMFDEAEHLEHPYFRTKHESERIVRREYTLAWRIYRPGIVVGHSDTGEMDKIDGPYYFFKLIQKMRKLLPPWLPSIGFEGGRLNLVPVDFVVKAMDHIAHARGLDGKTFHLTDPNPRRVGDVLNIFARAAHAPPMSLRINPQMFAFLPGPLKQAFALLAPVKKIQHAVLHELGLPPEVFGFINFPTRYDCREAQRVLAGSGIAVPPLEDYAWKLWDYWERHLDPELFVDRTLAGAVRGKVVLVTGAADGIGKAIGLKAHIAGATVVIVDRDAGKIERMRQDVGAAATGIAFHLCDLTDFDAVDALVRSVLSEHGGVDILINNAGRSIRRTVAESSERFHDFERTMRLNYFGALRITLGLLPSMRARGGGQVINISSIGVLTNAPRFSAYVASKAAMDAFANSAAGELAADNIVFSTVYMPLVRSTMTAPTELYQHVPMLSTDEAADLAAEAIIHRRERVMTGLGAFALALHALAPRLARVVMSVSYRMFSEPAGARRTPAGAPGEPAPAPTPDQVALTQLMRGMHF